MTSDSSEQLPTRVRDNLREKDLVSQVFRRDTLHCTISSGCCVRVFLFLTHRVAASYRARRWACGFPSVLRGSVFLLFYRYEGGFVRFQVFQWPGFDSLFLIRQVDLRRVRRFTRLIVVREGIPRGDNYVQVFIEGTFNYRGLGLFNVTMLFLQVV